MGTFSCSCDTSNNKSKTISLCKQVFPLSHLTKLNESWFGPQLSVSWVDMSKYNTTTHLFASSRTKIALRTDIFTHHASLMTTPYIKMFPPYTSISVALQSSTFTAVWHKWHLSPPVENEKLFLCHSRNELHIVDSSCENEKPV